MLGEVNRDYLQALDATVKIIVLFDFENEDFDFDSVVGDNINGGYLMTRHLVKQGYKDITFVGNFRATRSILDRSLEKIAISLFSSRAARILFWGISGICSITDSTV